MSEPSSSCTAGKLQTAATLASAVLPYVLLWGVLVWTLGIPVWISMTVAVAGGGVLVSTFVALRAEG